MNPLNSTIHTHSSTPSTRVQMCSGNWVMCNLAYMITSHLCYSQYLKGRGAAPFVIAILLAASMVFTPQDSVLCRTEHQKSWAEMLSCMLKHHQPPTGHLISVSPVSEVQIACLWFFLMCFCLVLVKSQTATCSASHIFIAIHHNLQQVCWHVTRSVTDDVLCWQDYNTASTALICCWTSEVKWEVQSIIRFEFSWIAHLVYFQHGYEWAIVSSLHLTACGLLQQNNNRVNLPHVHQTCMQSIQATYFTRWHAL